MVKYNKQDLCHYYLKNLFKIDQSASGVLSCWFGAISCDPDTDGQMVKPPSSHHGCYG